MTKKLPLVIAGAGGHAKVLADLIAADGRFRIVGATDPAPKGPAARLSGMNVIGGDAVLPKLLREGVKHAAVGVGSSPRTAPRARLRKELIELGFRVPALAHPRAVVSPGATLGHGVQVMAGAVINPGARVGAGCVVNTGAIVEHDCVLEADAFIGPGAVLGGEVFVGEGAFIGLGARINPGIAIGADAVVGAGAVVIKDVRPGTMVTGVPARERKGGS